MPSINTKIEWRDGLPYSSEFQDIYFSTDSGIAETHHVFIQHNQLSARWESLSKPNFTIAETGFGTGLNFLCAWKVWQETSPANAVLDFISFEKYPLAKEDMQRAIALWPEFGNLASQLLDAYHIEAHGTHLIELDQGKVRLTLIVGDVLDTIHSIDKKADAWFLDGFAPSKNPEMWQDVLFHHVARLSHQETTFATFTSAGMVKRGLQNVGFTVHKVAGFGKKREMLKGCFRQARQTTTSQHAIVIGGGIAGTATSRTLAERGWQVTLLERHSSLAQEASGNPVGVLYPRLTSGDTNLNRMALHSYLHTSHLLNRLDLKADDYQACGLLQLAFNDREMQRQSGILAQYLAPEILRQVDATEASALAGIALKHGGLYLPAAGWVHPPAFCQALANHPNIETRLEQNVLTLKRLGNLWQIWDKQKLIAESTVVVIASANETLSFSQSAHCQLEPVRGQITLARPSQESQNLKTVLCTDGYISPIRHGLHCLGATFSNSDTSLEIRESDNQTNLSGLSKIGKALSGLEIETGRTALRCASADYLPLAGRLLDAEQLRKAPPRHNADPASLPWLDGLYVNTGHGSKGLTTAPLCAEILACALNDEPAPVDEKLMVALDPNRFLLRELGLKRLLSSPYCKIAT